MADGQSMVYHICDIDGPTCCLQYIIQVDTLGTELQICGLVSRDIAVGHAYTLTAPQKQCTGYLIVWLTHYIQSVI